MSRFVMSEDDIVSAFSSPLRVVKDTNSRTIIRKREGSKLSFIEMVSDTGITIEQPNWELVPKSDYYKPLRRAF